MLFYNIGLRILHFFIWIAGFFNAKAKLFFVGRKQSFPKLLEFNKKRKLDEPLYWFHCASLGEFEQARPLMEAMKKTEPELKIAISFFSPSGYEIQKNFTGADLVFYLPMAVKTNAEKVLNILKPQKIFFIKYEFWLNYIIESNRLKIPVYLVSALFHRGQIFFQWYGKLFFTVLKKYTKIFVQDMASKQYLEQYQVNSVVSGDTRFDRVLTNKAKAGKNELIEIFSEGKKIIVLGSSWQPEEELIFKTYSASLHYKIIIAPHDIKRTIDIPGSLTAIKYSAANANNVIGKNVLIIDNIGMLSSLYSYATVAFVGGGFRGALHNILEAAVFGIPVLYGNQTQKHPEAEALQEAGGGIKIKDEMLLKSWLKILFTDENKTGEMGKNALLFIEQNAGATKKILNEI